MRASAGREGALQRDEALKGDENRGLAGSGRPLSAATGDSSDFRKLPRRSLWSVLVRPLFFIVVGCATMLAPVGSADIEATGAVGVGVVAAKAAAMTERFATEASTAASDVGRPDLAMALMRLVTASFVANKSASVSDDLLLPASREVDEAAWVDMGNVKEIRDTRHGGWGT